MKQTRVIKLSTKAEKDEHSIFYKRLNTVSFKNSLIDSGRTMVLSIYKRGLYYENIIMHLSDITLNRKYSLYGYKYGDFRSVISIDQRGKFI